MESSFNKMDQTDSGMVNEELHFIPTTVSRLQMKMKDKRVKQKLRDIQRDIAALQDLVEDGDDNDYN